MEYFDKKAVKILTNKFWDHGWRRNWFPDGYHPYPEPSLEDFAYAKEKGLMFDEQIIPHDEMIPRLLNAKELITFDKCAAAFLCSLSTREIALRSVIVSKLIAENMTDHKFTPYGLRDDSPNFKGYCQGCLDCGTARIGAVSREMDIYSFERIKFGGVDMSDPYRCMFDLETFPVEHDFTPTEEDISIFRNIISVCESCESDDAATQLCQKLAGVFKSNKNERSSLIEVLGWLRILSFVKIRPMRGSKNDWDSVSNWRGEDGIDHDMLNKYFGRYL